MTPEPSATITPSPNQAVDLAVSLGKTNLGPARTLLRWNRSTEQEIRAWAIRVRRDHTVNKVAILRRRSARKLIVERPDRLRIFYTVVALGAEGSVLAVSNEASVTAAN